MIPTTKSLAGMLSALALIVITTGCQTGPSLAELEAREFNSLEEAARLSNRTPVELPPIDLDSELGLDGISLDDDPLAGAVEEKWTAFDAGLPGTDQSAEKRDSTIVYFAYDQSTIAEAERQKLERLADRLKTAGHKEIVIEGHCDERGSDEYNRSLGEQRAMAVRDYLEQLGVKVALNTISYGEERPADTVDHKLNRRAEFVLN
jgi:peptidoglycan-associated lipoprotein